MPVPPGTPQRYNPNPAGGRTPGIPRRIGVTVRLEVPEHEKLHAAADALGTTLSMVMAELIRRLELDEHNRPTWAEHAESSIIAASRHMITSLLKERG